MKNWIVLVAAATLGYSAPVLGCGRSDRRQRLAKRKLQPNSELIDPTTLPKYVTDLVIPPVLFDDQGKKSNFEISIRQFSQQVLPPGYPETINWGYGDPSRPGTFNNPSFTVEVTRNVETFITWRNELLIDPVACTANGFNASNPACYYVPHILQDRNGTPVVDQSLHWANPNRLCLSGINRTDCEGSSTAPYFGPVPIVTHVHGAHVEYLSDGYAEAWMLPKASNIPAGYSTEGTFFRSRYLPSLGKPDDGNMFATDAGAEDKFFAPAAEAARGQGYAVYRYTNDQDTCTLFYHDHVLGMTRLNVYAGGAGFWLIRDAKNNENLLGPHDATGKPQHLPGPPATLGDDPNGDLSTRSAIREIPIAIQDKTFYKDGRQFYPANRAYFDYPDCVDGGLFGDSSLGIPYRPNSDVPLVWNPEAFFDTIVVNGNTFPKLQVAPERYRFRIVDACDSRSLNLALKIGSLSGTELPIFVIGTEQGLLPKVVKVRTGFITALKPGKPTKDTEAPDPNFALLMSPGERYDIIVDFTGLANGTEIYLTNTAPDEAFGGFGDGYVPADPDTTGQVLKFVINTSYSQKKDISTSPYNLITTSQTPEPLLPNKVGPPPKTVTVRDVALVELDSNVCVEQSPSNPCSISVVNCSLGTIDPLTGTSSLTYGPIQTRLGYNGRLGPGKLTTQRWMDPIQQNPPLGATEVWELWNWTDDNHPIHLHLVQFFVLGRYDFSGKLISAPVPYENYKKDTVNALPGQVTRIQITFDLPGYFVWHCHMTSHEDNEMMVPFCVGRKGIDCPASLF